MRKRLEGSFTVESSFIVPIFIFIIMALIASGFYVRNVILIKASAWKEGIRLEHITGSDSVGTKIGGIKNDLQTQIQENALFIKNVNVFVNAHDKTDTTIRVIAYPTFEVPVFFSGGAIDITEKIKRNNPASDLRKWHGMQMIMNNEKGK